MAQFSRAELVFIRDLFTLTGRMGADDPAIANAGLIGSFPVRRPKPPKNTA